jgi:hypothetical protein
MPVEHMVWLRFKPGVSPQRIEHHLAGLKALVGKVPVIQALKIGRNFTDRAQGYTHGLIVTVNCPNCLKAYLEHPEHVAVAGPLKQDADVLAMDIEA